MDIDHVVLWVKSAKDSLHFYVNTLGFEAEREKAFYAGEVLFPSVRINDKTILDIMEYGSLLTLVQKSTGTTANAGGMPINHLCLSLTQQEYDCIIERLNRSGVQLTSAGEHVFGAQGKAPCATYFNDIDGNIIEIRFYDN
ncbi:dioxygenase [Psychromonas marina]|uniref:Dioxygenase n=1 Tax=Psychromonas marina TaxID=88364 RepID=A0ABQ6DYS0_9GAMM|nr:VOC family protein [Psychromonas marina]GLS90140.1 dioxygenase [Psychromonas marina]